METPALRRLIAAELDSLRALRRDLHAHPELGYQEVRTSATVCAELERLGIAFVRGLAGGTGVVASLSATVGGGSDVAQEAGAIGLRADMDALPIHEETGLPYASKSPGLMHACGHDGHTTILLGAARVLNALPRPRPVTLVFQPAEEGGGGAERLCAEGALDGSVLGPPVQKMFGLHAWPDLELGTVSTRPGPLLASTDEIRIRIVGEQSHAAYPHYSRDPIVVAAHVVVALQTVVSRNTSPLDACVVTLGTIKGGTATNIIPQHVSLSGTIRSLCPKVRAAARQRVREIAEGVAQGLGCRAEVELDEGYPVTYNDPALTERFFDIARRAIGAERVGLTPHPTMGGEDFSYYAQRVPGVFFCLGMRPTGTPRYPTLHQPDFDFNDDALGLGVEMMCRVALEA